MRACQGWPRHALVCWSYTTACVVPPSCQLVRCCQPALHARPRWLPDFDPRDGSREARSITHLVQAIRSDGVREVGDGTTGSGTTMGTPPAVSRSKAGSPKDGVDDGDSNDAVSREATEAPREVASMVWHRGRRRCRGWENWAA
jgi:hypothetical protein